MKYERLGLFCFFCGIMGHSEKFCRNRAKEVSGETSLPYGSWLRATARAKRFENDFWSSTSTINIEEDDEGFWQTEKNRGDKAKTWRRNVDLDDEHIKKHNPMMRNTEEPTNTR